jgi:hypothetical protein
MTRRNSRGLTIIELLFVVGFFGLFSLSIYYFVVAREAAVPAANAVFDYRSAARAWAEELKYEVVAVSCANILEGGFVRCTVRVGGSQELVPVECSIISKSCAQMRTLQP